MKLVQTHKPVIICWNVQTVEDLLKTFIENVYYFNTCYVLSKQVYLDYTVFEMR